MASRPNCLIKVPVIKSWRSDSQRSSIKICVISAQKQPPFLQLTCMSFKSIRILCLKTRKRPLRAGWVNSIYRRVRPRRWRVLSRCEATWLRWRHQRRRPRVLTGPWQSTTAQLILPSINTTLFYHAAARMLRLSRCSVTVEKIMSVEFRKQRVISQCKKHLRAWQDKTGTMTHASRKWSEPQQNLKRRK